MSTAYLAAEGFEADLETELTLAGIAVVQRHDRLFVTDAPAIHAAWAQNIWHDAQIIPIASIGEGAKALKAMQRNWWPYAPRLQGRTKLMVEKLPKVSAKPVIFPNPAPTAPLGSFTLLDEGTMLAAPRCSSAFANGEIHFVEDRVTPPNRAYLKLWDLFTRLGLYPRPGQRCLDLGACPGGWSWVIASLGADVISIDKAPLDPKVAALPQVTQRNESAFGLDPASIGPVDWLFSDIICYPERLLRLVERWRASGLVKNFACTIKFQGPTDHAMTQAFAAIPGSRVMHLFHNKHELTWVLLDQGIGPSP